MRRGVVNTGAISSMGRRWPPGIVSVGVLATFLFLMLGWTSAAHAAGHTTLEVVNGGEAQTVELSTEGSPPSLVGETTLFVRLKELKDPMLYVRFLPEKGSDKRTLCGEEPRIFLDGNPADSGCHFSPAPIEGKDLIPLRIGFRLPVGEPETSVAGNLILGLKGKDEGAPIPIAATPRQFKDLTVNPSSLILDSENPDATVTLTGPDLVQFLRSARPGGFFTQLRSTTGDTTTASIRFPAAGKIARSNHPALATGTVSLSNSSPPPGKYSGKVLLSDVSTDGPAVDVELHSHLCFWVLVILAFVGVLIGGVFTRLYTLAMRRSLLLKMLDQSMDAYRYAQKTGPTQAWRLEDLIDSKSLPGATEVNERRLQGLPALRSSIEQARSSGDLDEDAERVLDMIARIQRWLRVEPAARRLALVNEEEKPVKNPPRMTWEGSHTVIDTAILLEMARREPTDSVEADDLVRRLLEQARWHHLMVAVWEAAVDKKSLAAKVKRLDDALGKGKSAEERTPAEQDMLDARLDALVARLKPPLCDPGFPELDEPTAEITRDTGITPVNWETSSNSFTGWATLDKESYGQLSRRAAKSARALSTIDLRMELRSLSPADAGWTLLALAVASVGYGLTGYSDTWGSCEDMAKAVLAGLTGTIAINWAALPIFGSIRLRAAKLP